MAEMTVGPPAADDNLFFPVPVAMVAEPVSEGVGLGRRPPEVRRPTRRKAFASLSVASRYLSNSSRPRRW